MPPKRQHTHDDDESREGSSVAGDHLEEDTDGKEKKSSSSQIRKAQNRIAQREFRLRKQIRDLEARVEVLSGDKEERVELMLLLIRNLLKENKELRGMLKNMASFVGEGLGSCLPRLGLTNEQLESILNRADSDTAYEAFVSFKASKELGEANPGIPLGQVRKRGDSTAEPGSSAGAGSLIGTPLSAAAQAKRKRDNDGGEGEKRARGTTPASTPGSSGAGAGGGSGSQPVNHGEMWNFLFTTEATAVGGPGPSAFPGLYTAPPGTAQQTTMPAPPAQSQGHITGVVGLSPESERNNLRSAVAQLTSSDKAPMDRQGSVIVTEPNNMTRGQVEERRRMQEELRQSMEGEEAAERKTEALQLITYHLNNFRINHEYMLPPSLRPTPVQQTIPHEHAIDGILFPSVRDRMILLRGRYDLLEAFHGYVTEFTLHGDDALDHRNWEASEKWLTQFKILVDDEVYAITNRWRATRGLPPLKRDAREADAIGTSAGGSGLGTGAGLTTELMDSMQQQQQQQQHHQQQQQQQGPPQ